MATIYSRCGNWLEKVRLLNDPQSILADGPGACSDLGFNWDEHLQASPGSFHSQTPANHFLLLTVKLLGGVGGSKLPSASSAAN